QGTAQYRLADFVLPGQCPAQRRRQGGANRRGGGRIVRRLSVALAGTRAFFGHERSGAISSLLESPFAATDQPVAAAGGGAAALGSYGRSGSGVCRVIRRRIGVASRKIPGLRPALSA